MIDYLTSFDFTSALAIFLYWIPALICLSVYSVRAVRYYKDDLTKCTDDYYRPNLTVGRLVWWILCSITPGANLFALVFDCASSIMGFLVDVLDIPLVPKRKLQD